MSRTGQTDPPQFGQSDPSFGVDERSFWQFRVEVNEPDGTPAPRARGQARRRRAGAALPAAGSRITSLLRVSADTLRRWLHRWREDKLALKPRGRRVQRPHA